MSYHYTNCIPDTDTNEYKYNSTIFEKYSYPKNKYQLNILIDPDLKSKNLSLYKQLLEWYTKKSSNEYNYDGDCGIDLMNDDVTVESFKVGIVDFSIRCELFDIQTNELQSYFLIPRSSFSKTNFQVANSIGVIDAGYRGNISSRIRCFKIDEFDTLPKGSFYQIVSADLKPIKVKLVSELSTSQRNINGYGSTSNNV